MKTHHGLATYYLQRNARSDGEADHGGTCVCGCREVIHTTVDGLLTGPCLKRGCNCPAFRPCESLPA
jgi:hypothetical protein